jgi:hypothetical protein
MKKIFILIFVILSFNAEASTLENNYEVSKIYIEAQGNNKYEARLKAHEKGMYRVILMIADKIGINKADIEKITYPRMKQVFTVTSTLNEIETDDSYSATVSYKYNLKALNQVLLDYGNSNVDERFYEYLVLPVFKQRKVLSIWDENQLWNKLWATDRPNLEQHKLYYPKGNRDLEKKVNQQTIFDLNYQDYLTIFQNSLFKNVMLLICEYFTDVNTGEAVMVVNTVIISPDKDRKLTAQEYPIENQEEISLLMEDAIAKITSDYGRLKGGIVQIEKALDVGDILEESQNENSRNILLNVEVFDEEELLNIQHKLENVKEVDSFTINHDYDKKYKVSITTTSSDAELAEGFYLNGLSFRIYGNLYNLIDVKEGG